MDSPRLSSLRITLVAGLALLTTDVLFAQNTDQSDVDALKTQINQMQRQYEQRIEAMEVKMKTLESNANGGSILNTRVLTDADGKGVAPAPMLDESFLKSLTRNFTFSVYIRSGVGTNGNGGPQDFDFQIPDFGLGRFRLGNEPDTYMELTWKQAHLLGDSPDVMDVAMTFTERFSYQTTKTTNVSQFDSGAQLALRQAFLEAKNFIKSAPDVTVWAGQRFYDRHDIHMHYLYFDDYSGYGLGFDNIDLGFGKLLISYLGGYRDGLDNGNTTAAETTLIDPHRSGLNLSTLDVRIHDINLLCGTLELIGDYQFFKGGNYQINNGASGLVTGFPLNIGDTSGFRVGAIYYHPICPTTGASWYNTSFWQISAIYGYGASELFGTDPNNQLGVRQGYILNSNLERVNPDGTISSGSLRRASQFRATGQMVWNVNPCFAIAAEVHYRYDDQGAINAETVNAVTGLSAPISSAGSTVRTTGGSSWVLGGGIRPVVWLNDWFALQGQAGIDYVSRNRAGGQALNPNGTLRNDSFGNSGALGVFTFAPTIKPRGNWWTRPEFRAFVTYAIWAKALEGSIGNDGGGNAPYRNEREGWTVGVQTEWFF